jgi:small redox-active disulfide protein 2
MPFGLTPGYFTNKHKEIMAEDIVQMKIGKYRTGIIGLKKVCEELSGRYSGMSEREIRDFLMTELQKTNYISENVKKSYEDAFFAAFKAFLGEPISSDSITGVEIKILGQGCARCNQLEQDVMNIVAEMKIDADIEHVSDIKAIADYGVLGLPGLVINGKVKAAGNIPPKGKIIGWIKDALKEAGL